MTLVRPRCDGTAAWRELGDSEPGAVYSLILREPRPTDEAT